MLVSRSEKTSTAEDILFESNLDLIEKTRFLAHQPVVTPSQHLKFLSLLGIGLKSSRSRSVLTNCANT